MNEQITYKGITASAEAWAGIGIEFYDDCRPNHESRERFATMSGSSYGHYPSSLFALLHRAIDALPEGAHGEQILRRAATLAARDRNMAAFAKFGSRIPTNINVWHQVPELRVLLDESTE